MKSKTSLECNYFHECNAPICPMDKESMREAVWFADEEICRVKEHRKLPWVRNQRKILSRSRKKRVDGAFSTTMLDREMVVRNGISGIDPDADDFDKKASKWGSSRTEKVKRPLSEERKKQLKRQLANARKNQKKRRSSLAVG